MCTDRNITVQACTYSHRSVIRWLPVRACTAQHSNSLLSTVRDTSINNAEFCVFQSLINAVRITISVYFVNCKAILWTVSETDVLNSKNITCLCCYRIGTARSFGPFGQLISCR
jgi:hypothetical protein